MARLWGSKHRMSFIAFKTCRSRLPLKLSKLRNLLLSCK